MTTVIGIDDNELILTDIREAATEAAKLPCHAIKTVSDESEALRIISQTSAAQFVPLFIVDMAMQSPDSGFRVISAIRANEALIEAPIVVLTSAQDAQTVREAYELGANSYFVKSSNPDEVRRTIEKIIAYWITKVAKLRNGAGIVGDDHGF